HRRAPADAGRVLGADARPFHRTGTRGTRVLHRAHVRAAELAADTEHRTPRGDGGDGRLDGTGVRDRGEDGGHARLGRLLGQALSYPPTRAKRYLPTRAKPRGERCNDSDPDSVISMSSPLCTPARSSVVI